MKAWKLCRHLTDTNKFRILQLLAQDPLSPKTLSKRTGVKPSTIRSDLKALRKAGFIEPHGRSQNRTYEIADPLPSANHELLLTVVLRSKVKTRARPKAEETSPPEVLLDRYRGEIFKEVTKTILEQVFVTHSYRQRKRSIEDLEETLRELDDKYGPRET